MKQRILIFSDCYIYGGSERLMMFLLGNEIIKSSFELNFAYRTHKDYETGLNIDLKKFDIEAKLFPLHLMDNVTRFYKINTLRLPGFVKQLLKLPFHIAQQMGLYRWYNVAALTRFLKKVKPDMIHVNNGGYPGAGSCNHLVLAAKKSGICKVVYQVNNIAEPPKKIRERRFDRLLQSNINYYITASSRAKLALMDNRGIPADKIKQIPNTVMAEHVSCSRADVLKALNWSQDTFLLIQVAFLTKRKGQIYLLKALREIRKINEQIKVILVGNGEDEHELKQYVAAHQLEDAVFFAGYRSDSINFIGASDIFLLPSVSNEDMPLVMLSAMGLGKAIISTQLAGIAEAIKHGENGVLIDNDPATLAEHLAQEIMRLYNNQTLISAYGDKAKHVFAEKYSEKAYGEKLSRLYLETLNSKDNKV